MFHGPRILKEVCRDGCQGHDLQIVLPISLPCPPIGLPAGPLAPERSKHGQAAQGVKTAPAPGEARRGRSGRRARPPEAGRPGRAVSSRVLSGPAVPAAEPNKGCKVWNRAVYLHGRGGLAGGTPGHQEVTTRLPLVSPSDGGEGIGKHGPFRRV